MRFYLLDGSSMDTGESFLSLEEVHYWFHDTTGRWPTVAEKRAMREGGDFEVGSRYFKIEKRKTNSLSCVA